MSFILYLKIYLRSIRNRDWDKLNREKEEDLFMRESKMGDCNRHLNSKLFVPNNYSPISVLCAFHPIIMTVHFFSTVSEPLFSMALLEISTVIVNLLIWHTDNAATILSICRYVTSSYTVHSRMLCSP